MKYGSIKLSNLALRVIVAVIGVLVILSSIYWNPWSYFIVFFVICAVTMREFYKLIGIEGFLPLSFWGGFLGMLIYTMTFLIQIDKIPLKYLIIVFPVSAIIFFIKLYKKSDLAPFTNIGYTFLGVVYVAVPFSLFHIIAFYSGAYGAGTVMGILFLTWASDTGGYFAGTYFGRTKLFERISPMKSWEGFIGGAVLTLAIALLLSLVFDDLPAWKWFVIGILTVTAGTYGDLVESLFKRSIRIKDSGRLLPGHGGFLDRFDALLLSLPFTAAFVVLF